MFDASKIASEFDQFNGFYKSANARQVIYNIYKGKCASTGREIDLADADIGHIIPQSDPAFFEAMFPGLDVHNIINLQLLHAGENRKVGNTYVQSPLMLATAFAYTARLVRTRYHKVVKNADNQVFDAEHWIEKLTERHMVDFSKSLAAAVPYGDYMCVCVQMIADDYAQATRGTSFEEDSHTSNEYRGAECFPVSAYVQTSIQESLCRQVSGRVRKASKTSQHVDTLLHELNNKRSATNIRCGLRRDIRQGPPPAEEFTGLPDGEWLLYPQSEGILSPTVSIERADQQHWLLMQVLKVLRDREVDPRIVGKSGRSNIIHINDPESLEKLHDALACHEETSSPSGLIDFKAPIRFAHSGGNTLDKEFLRAEQALEQSGQSNFALMFKKDYASLMKRLQRHAISTLNAHGFIE